MRNEDQLPNFGFNIFLWFPLLKEFLRAERIGDWKTHLKSVKEMLPYFHASGHFPYAKSAHLYLQDMQNCKI